MDNHTILIVDDEPLLLYSIGNTLKKTGHTVMTASSGQAAFDILIETSFDLVITDLIMKPVDGFQVLKMVKELNPETFVIIMSGQGDMTSVIQALRFGADDYLSKQCIADEIHFRVRHNLERIEDRKRIKNAEEATKKSEERTEMALRGGNLGLWEWDLNSDTITIDERFTNNLGYAHKIVKNNPNDLKPVIHTEDLKIIQKKLIEYLKGNTQFFESEFRVTDDSGKENWISARGKTIRWDETARVTCMAGTHMNITDRKNSEKERERLISELTEALANIKTLKGMLPICAKCKKIRDDKGYWNQIEEYIEKHTDALFSHGLCSKCEQELYGNLPWYKKKL